MIMRFQFGIIFRAPATWSITIMTHILTEAGTARAVLLANFDDYLVKQRGLSARTIYHTLRFANRFLDHRFGDGAISLALSSMFWRQHAATRRLRRMFVSSSNICSGAGRRPAIWR
jgi:hypothetical protein